ncbi:alpha/beta hydrolase [Streptomyces sp. HNM0574]|uniref:alpha/beta fold hydrolase n=1 Tax=Streptomyces sp. HNM0574 TaxID=2714954 RepID=UPI00146F58E7|nr:alpha/beta hydrolase [Streptomyces sp. HNM0574]NLU67561.1 alpha/beta fold hydrolase [Streptomyces sp. HNM0574]
MDATETEIAGPAGPIAVVDGHGDGPDVVLCHGGNRTLLDWEPLLPHLSGFRTVAYDLRGHGRSASPGDGDYSWDAHLADLDAVIAATGLDSPFVVGHSLGGMLAVCHAARTPSCPGAVDLDGFGGSLPGTHPGLSPEETERRMRRQVAELAAALGPDVVDEAYTATLDAQAGQRATALGVDPERERATARRAREPVPGGVRRKPAPSEQPALVAPLLGWSVFTELRALGGRPALLVRGANPPPTEHLPEEYRELTESLLLGIGREFAALRAARGPVRTAEVAGTGHMLHLQAPDTVGPLVRDFLHAAWES